MRATHDSCVTSVFVESLNESGVSAALCCGAADTVPARALKLALVLAKFLTPPKIALL